MKKIKDFTTFVNENIQNKEEIQPKEDNQKETDKLQKEVQPDINFRDAYREFFKNKLQKYGVKNIGQLADKKSDFFKEIKLEWPKHKESMLKESSGDIPKYVLDIKNEYSKLKKGVQGGTIDLGKTFGKDVSQTDIKNILQKYPDAEVFYQNGRTLLKLKD